MRRAQRGAEREELLASLEELATWYRDLAAVAVGATGAAVHRDRLDELREDATPERIARRRTGGRDRPRDLAAARGVQHRVPLALEALFIHLRRAFAVAPAAA